MATGRYEYQSEFAKRYVAEGRAEGLAQGKAEGLAEGEAKGLAEGEARSILAVLEARGLSVDPAIRERILGCREPELLDRWLKRAATVAKVGEMFD